MSPKSVAVKVIVIAAGVVAVSAGAAGAASSASPVILGKTNTAHTTTVIANSNGTPLALSARAGSAPLSVNSPVKVTDLNADRLDGVDSSDLQRRITSTCSTSQAITSVNADGTVVCTSVASNGGGGNGTNFYGRLGTVSRGVGIAYCPSGTAPIGGGGLPDVNGATDIPFLAMSMVHVTDRSFDGWEVIFSDANRSYGGGGYVYVTCTSAAVSTTSAAATANQKQTDRMAALVRRSH